MGGLDSGAIASGVVIVPVSPPEPEPEGEASMIQSDPPESQLATPIATAPQVSAHRRNDMGILKAVDVPYATTKRFQRA
jgi:hypothetical protein